MDSWTRFRRFKLLGFMLLWFICNSLWGEIYQKVTNLWGEGISFWKVLWEIKSFPAALQHMLWTIIYQFLSCSLEQLAAQETRKQEKRDARRNKVEEEGWQLHVKSKTNFTLPPCLLELRRIILAWRICNNPKQIFYHYLPPTTREMMWNIPKSRMINIGHMSIVLIERPSIEVNMTIP